MRLIKTIVKLLAAGVIGAFLVLLVGGVVFLEQRPDLKVWHEPLLDEEFTTNSDVASFTDYLALEDRLFAQLKSEIYDAVAPEDRTRINRYTQGSLSDPEIWPVNWNRSYELPAERPKAAVVLVHGMSDSPYSLRQMALALNQAGAWVIGLRLPGNGTAPSGLLDARWQDMARALELAAIHLRGKTGDAPLFIVGYSIGGALGVHYALTVREEPALPKLAGLVLISPAIGVTRLAALSVWQERLGHLLGLEKLAWNGIQLEYDPYKYGSFAINAATQVYLLTQEIQSDLSRLSAAGQLNELPPILAFQSAVDATVLPGAVIDALFGQLPLGDHELVLFDVNRRSEVGQVLNEDPKATIDALFARPDLPFTLSLVTNETETSRRRGLAPAPGGQRRDRDRAAWPGLADRHLFPLPRRPAICARRPALRRGRAGRQPGHRARHPGPARRARRAQDLRRRHAAAALEPLLRLYRRAHACLHGAERGADGLGPTPIRSAAGPGRGTAWQPRRRSARTLRP